MTARLALAEHLGPGSSKVQYKDSALLGSFSERLSSLTYFCMKAIKISWCMVPSV